VDKNLDALAGEIAALGEAVKKTVEPAVAAAAEAKAAAEAVKVEVKAQREWMKEIEDRLERSRFGGVGRFVAGDALKSAIPDRMLPMVEAHGRVGTPDPVRRAAIEAWMKCAGLMCVPKYAGVTMAQIAEEKDRLERALNGPYVMKTSFAEGAGATGGYTVPTPLEAEVLRITEDTGVVRPLARKMTMTALSHLIPDDQGGVTVAVVNEAATISQSEPTFGQKTLSAKMIAARGLASLQVLQDSSIGLAQYWLERASEAYALFEDNQALEGDGSGSNFTGLIAASGVNAQVHGSSATVAITYAALVATAYKGRKRATRRANAAFVMSDKALRDVVALVSSGVPILNRSDVARVLSENIVGPGYGEGTILGFPVYTTEQISTTRTVASDTDGSNIYFGPFQQGMIFGDLLGLTFDVSEHVAFNTAQLAMRLLKRTAILVGVPAYFTKCTGVKIVA